AGRLRHGPRPPGTLAARLASDSPMEKRSNAFGLPSPTSCPSPAT
ncbi:unnamed protein product, partial [Tilletia controversa]